MSLYCMVPQYIYALWLTILLVIHLDQVTDRLCTMCTSNLRKISVLLRLYDKMLLVSRAGPPIVVIAGQYFFMFHIINSEQLFKAIHYTSTVP